MLDQQERKEERRGKSAGNPNRISNQNRYKQPISYVFHWQPISYPFRRTSIYPSLLSLPTELVGVPLPRFSSLSKPSEIWDFEWWKKLSDGSSEERPCWQRNSDRGSPLSLIVGSLCIKHPNLFGKSEKLDVLWDKGLSDSNILIAYRKPRPEWLAQHSFVIQHSVSPEIGIHGVPVDNFSRTGSGGVNLCRFSAGLDLDEPGSSNWSSKTSIKFEHVRPVNDDGHSITRDIHGFTVTSSGSCHDSMVVLKQESRFAKANDHSFTRFSLQIEQGIPLMSKWLIFNRFKFAASKGVRAGPGFLLASITGGSIVGDIAPYQAFAIGGLGSVRGYGEGAVGSGRSCLVANTELTFPMNQMLDGALFCDVGSDLGSGRYVPENPNRVEEKPSLISFFIRKP
ncbi:Bacterial surface antigen (D15) [Cynara cardunculus var. scolymus]|uniref:Bacterial surface antigen (D15) n=1 Tax=Cynara cardunculus var. scolymus TaxID=59895 RepID=A0A118K4V9_CYNCS|nr:Bacterial surface antigen (D15) [Cynara cardunculus var. scolymus]